MQRPKNLSLLLSAIALGAGLLPISSRAGELQKGDVIAICGDSITEQKKYSRLMADYFLLCQPQPNLEAVQFGWSGETSWGFRDRLKNDVLPFKPTVATTCYGMNDGGYTAATPERLDQYRKATEAIVKLFQEGGVRFIVIGGPGAVDTATFKRIKPEVYNDTLAQLTQIAKEVAQQAGVGFADVHSLMIDAMAKAKAKYGQDFPVAGPDGVHPGLDGHLVMAYAFLKALGCSGDIGTFTVNFKSGEATASDGHKILSSANGVVEIESSKYPFCFSGEPTSPESARGMLDFVPFNQDLNRLMLVVKDAPAKAKVTWGEKSKEFTAEQLAAGVNLAVEFPDNPFSAPFEAADRAIAQQQAFETPAIKGVLHSLPDWLKNFPKESGTIQQFQDGILKLSRDYRDASRAAVVPVKHTIKIEAVQ